MCLQQLARKNYLVENKKGFHIHLKINWETGMNRNHEFFLYPPLLCSSLLLFLKTPYAQTGGLAKQQSFKTHIKILFPALSCPQA